MQIKTNETTLFWRGKYYHIDTENKLAFAPHHICQAQSCYHRLATRKKITPDMFLSPRRRSFLKRILGNTVLCCTAKKQKMEKPMDKDRDEISQLTLIAARHAAICNILDGLEVSDFLESFPEVMRVADLYAAAQPAVQLEPVR